MSQFGNWLRGAAITLCGFIKNKHRNNNIDHRLYKKIDMDQVFLRPADAILSAGPALYKCIKDRLPNKNIDTALFVEFNWEAVCYVLHLLDRSLSDITSHSNRFEIIEKLLNAIEAKDAINLREIGYDVSSREVAESFRRMFNQRTLDYGKFRVNWYSNVAVAFGRNAADALELPDANYAILSLYISTLGPTLYMDLIPHFDALFKLALEKTQRS